MKTYNASDLFLGIEENHILCSRGDFAIGYKIDYPEKYSLNRDDIDGLQVLWSKVIKNLPPRTIVVKSDIYDKTKFDASEMPKNTFLEKATKKYFEQREYMQHAGYIFFIYTKIDTLKNEKAKNPFIFPKIDDFAKEDARIKAFISEINQARELLMQNGIIKLIPLTPKEITEYRNFYFNGFQTDYLTDLYMDNDYILSDGKRAGMFSICNEEYLPTITHPAVKDNRFTDTQKDFSYYSSYMDELGLSLSGCSHMYNQIIFVDDARSHIKELEKRYNKIYAARNMDSFNAHNAENIKECLEEVHKDEDFRFIRGNNNIIFWSDNRAQFDITKDRITSILREKEFIPVYPTRNRLKETYYNSFFANVSCFGNDNLYITDLRVATCLFINTTNYKNDDVGIYFNDRLYNIPVRYDFWDADKKRKASRNFVIFTKTGGGKTYTALHMFSQLIEQNTVFVIIDLGGSYRTLARLLPKKDVAIFRYNPGTPLGMNPFALEQGEELTSVKIEEVGQFVWTLIKKESLPTELEKTSMRKLILAYYAYVDDYNWQTFYDFIKDNKSNIKQIAKIEEKEENSLFNIEEFLHAGSDFIDGGAYPELLRISSEDISMNFKGKRLIIFELDEARNNTLLLTILLQVISETIQKVVWKDKTRKGYVFFEEFAESVKYKGVFTSVLYYAQAIRKQNGGIGLVLQNINQLPGGDETIALLKNLETSIFLAGGDYKDEILRLGLSTHDACQITSMKSQFSREYSQRYSELYIKSKNAPGNVYRIESPKEVFYAFQTEGAIQEKMAKMYEEYGDMETVIKKCIEIDLEKICIEEAKQTKPETQKS